MIPLDNLDKIILAAAGLGSLAIAVRASMPKRYENHVPSNAELQRMESDIKRSVKRYRHNPLSDEYNSLQKRIGLLQRLAGITIHGNNQRYDPLNDSMKRPVEGPIEYAGRTVPEDIFCRCTELSEELYRQR